VKKLEDAQIFQDYDEMLEKADIKAVVVASITAVHAE
jgi:myo-inositol 2-dehydrogenase/D-chiro-inositol 1-dehydrogenase